MRELHPNKRLQNFSISAANGNSKVGVSDIQNMSTDEYAALRLAVKRRALSKGNTHAARKQAKELLRKLAIARKTKDRVYGPQLVFEKSDSQLLDAFYPERHRDGVWKEYSKRKKDFTEVHLQNFSLIDEPEQTFERLSEIAKAESDSKHLLVNYGDGMCYDMSAYLLWALMRKDLPPQLLRGGHITTEVREVLRSVGLLEFMNIMPHSDMDPARKQMSLDGVLSDSCLDDIMPFSLRTGGGLDAEKLATSEQRDEKVSEQFVNELKKWVKKHNPTQDLTEASSKIREIMTELFDNALRHADPENETGEWSTVGVLQKLKDSCGRDIVACNIVILNFGQSISETLEYAPDHVLDDIGAYVSMHKDHFDEDVLKTVCAMQDKISRIHPDPSKGNATLNGVGLMTSVIEVMDPLFGSNLPQYQPSFTLISGNAWLNASSFDVSNMDELGKRKLAFNTNNDITQPPDEQHVKALKGNFPGTIISLRFVIGADQLKDE